MKNNIYIRQIYEEGLGTTFYQKPKNFINNKIKNNLLKSICLFGLEVIYTVLIILVIVIVFNLNFPL